MGAAPVLSVVAEVPHVWLTVAAVQQGLAFINRPVPLGQGETKHLHTLGQRRALRRVIDAVCVEIDLPLGHKLGWYFAGIKAQEVADLT